MTEAQPRKAIGATLSEDNVKKLEELSEKKGIPKTRVLDTAVDNLYKQEGNTAKHKGIVITVANHKGGCGKTTSTAAFAHLLSKMGYHILLIDADPQGNLSGRFGYDYVSSPQNLREDYFGSLIKDRLSGEAHKEFTAYIEHPQEYPSIDIIYSDLRLDDVYAEMNAKGASGYTVVRKIIQEAKSRDIYDFILIDSRPAINMEVSTIFLATDYVIIPVEPAFDSILGANSMVRFVGKNRELNPKLSIIGVFMTKVRGRTIAFENMSDMVQGGWDQKFFKNTIPFNQDVINAENDGGPVTKLKPSCKASKAYEKLIREVVERIEKD